LPWEQVWAGYDLSFVIRFDFGFKTYILLMKSTKDGLEITTLPTRF
jgi:hypothetical protein